MKSKPTSAEHEPFCHRLRWRCGLKYNDIGNIVPTFTSPPSLAVWIEIQGERCAGTNDTSHRLRWRCGLKSQAHGQSVRSVSHRLRWRCGLKCHDPLGNFLAFGHRLRWRCGLKSIISTQCQKRTMVTAFAGGVD